MGGRWALGLGGRGYRRNRGRVGGRRGRPPAVLQYRLRHLRDVSGDLFRGGGLEGVRGEVALREVALR